MPAIEHWMPPSAAGKDAHFGGLRSTYAHATAHMRESLAYHMPNNAPAIIWLSPELAHSRVLGAQLDQSASIQPHIRANRTRTLGWNMCTSPAKRSWRLKPANRRILALRGRLAAPTAGGRGSAPSRTSMCSTVCARCIRCAWRLRSSGAPRPKRAFT
jgi:hypothetical protein